jgi:hypothetical protein
MNANARRASKRPTIIRFKQPCPKYVLRKSTTFFLPGLVPFCQSPTENVALSLSHPNTYFHAGQAIQNQSIPVLYGPA